MTKQQEGALQFSFEQDLNGFFKLEEEKKLSLQICLKSKSDLAFQYQEGVTKNLEDLKKLVAESQNAMPPQAIDSLKKILNKLGIRYDELTSKIFKLTLTASESNLPEQMSPNITEALKFLAKLNNDVRNTHNKICEWKQLAKLRSENEKLKEELRTPIPAPAKTQ